MKKQVMKKRTPYHRSKNYQDRNNNHQVVENGTEYNVFLGSKQYQKAIQTRSRCLELAKESASSGDKVKAEEYLQCADHYSRIINEAHEINKKSKPHVETNSLDTKSENTNQNSSKESEFNSESNENAVESTIIKEFQPDIKEESKLQPEECTSN
ncbi:MAG: DUF4167 domain-containing protein [Sphingobacteriia bacterium]|nr:DUF4167 domain-containing protein [Sphingobacteriia bacterium]